MPDRLSSSDLKLSLQRLHKDWSFGNSETQIERNFEFNNYYECISCVNAIAWIAHQQNHHPDMLVKYKTCQVIYTTHSKGGLTSLDFIAAETIDEMINIA